MNIQIRCCVTANTCDDSVQGDYSRACRRLFGRPPSLQTSLRTFGILVTVPVNRVTAYVKQAYALCAGPLITPQPPDTTSNVFDLCCKQTRHSSVEMLCMRYTLEQHMFMYDAYLEGGCARKVRKLFLHTFQDVTVPNRENNSSYSLEYSYMDGRYWA